MKHIEQVMNLAGNDLEEAAGLLDISVPELCRWIRKFEIYERSDVRITDARVIVSTDGDNEPGTTAGGRHHAMPVLAREKCL